MLLQRCCEDTFIDFDDASMALCYRKLRRFATDSVLARVLDVPAAYEPGKFSDKQDEHEARRRIAAKVATQEAQGRVVVEEPKIKPRDAGRDAPKQSAPAERTTVMLRNVPNNYTREMLLTLLDAQGLAGCYDFVYLPCDFYRAANLGYAFVNMVDGTAVDAVWKALDGFSEWSMPTSKVCQVGWHRITFAQKADEALLVALRQLQLRELASLAAAAKALRQACLWPELWRAALLQRFPERAAKGGWRLQLATALREQLEQERLKHRRVQQRLQQIQQQRLESEKQQHQRRQELLQKQQLLSQCCVVAKARGGEAPQCRGGGVAGDAAEAGCGTAGALQGWPLPCRGSRRRSGRDGSETGTLGCASGAAAKDPGAARARCCCSRSGGRAGHASATGVR
ncbi:unnamed protein product [Effrenium voratum]|nr:unnamed protein product [Effrenium voratum]